MHLAGVEGIELDAEIRVSEFGTAHYFLDALGESASRLRLPGLHVA